jgi:hypothetical protein
MTKPAEKNENEIEYNLINIPEINNDNLIDTPVNMRRKNSHSEYWSGTLPSKIDSGYNSESIQIFKINKRENQNETKNMIDPEGRTSKCQKVFPIELNAEPIDSIKAVRNSNYNQVVNIYKDNSIFFQNNQSSKMNSNQNMIYADQPNKTTNLNNSSIYLDERISKIDRKMGSLQNVEHKDISIHENRIFNFDSRILSVNDMSGMDESKILKRKSFLSYNN